MPSSSFVLVLIASLGGSSALASFPGYSEKFFNQTLDHFNPADSRHWQHRYLVNDSYWDGRGKLKNGCRGPILLYTGNEGDITAFWGSNGFMIEVLAPKLGGLLLFPEERYYGKSMPFGPDSLTAENLVYLTTEQVIEDYVDLLYHIKSSTNSENCPVIAFGGSYGGTLTTFLRASHPEAVVGGLAASAPIGYYDKHGWSEHGVTQYTWSDIVTKSYAEAHPQCLQTIVDAVSAINNAPIEMLVRAFHVCEPAGLGPNAPSELFQYALENLPQENYPYPVGNNPGWPVNATCDRLVAAATSETSLIEAAASFAAESFGYSSGGPCIATLTEGPGSVPGDGPGPGNWGWQSCTENLHQFSSRGVRNFTFNLQTNAIDVCNAAFNQSVSPDTTALTRQYGGYALAYGDVSSGVSNLIWSNGGLDPWGGGGFIKPGNPDSGNHWIWMAKGAHHLDLRGPHPQDPPEVTAARKKEEEIITQWIMDASNV